MDPRIETSPNPQTTVATKKVSSETNTPTEASSSSLKEKILTQAPIIVQLADSFASLKDTIISKTAEASAALVQSQPITNLLDQTINFVSEQVTAASSSEPEITEATNPVTEKQTEPQAEAPIEKPGLLTRCLNWCKSLVQPQNKTTKDETTPSLWDTVVSGAKAVASFIASPVASVSSFISSFYTTPTINDSPTNSFTSWISSITQPVTDWVSSLWNNQDSNISLEPTNNNSNSFKTSSESLPAAPISVLGTALVEETPISSTIEKREIANCKYESLPTELINLAREFGIPISSSTQAIEIYSKLPAAKLQSYLRSRGIDISGVLNELSNNGLGHLQVAVLTKALQDRTPYAAREIAKLALAQDFKAKHIADANVSIDTIQTVKRNYII